jgi:hypothetical protein
MSQNVTAAAVRAPAAQVAVAAGALVGAVGAAAYISSFFLLPDLSGREAMSSPLCVTANAVMAIGFAIVTLALPTFGTYTRVPRWAVMTSAAGCLALTVLPWASIMAADFVDLVTDAEWDNPGALALAGFLPKIALCGVGFMALAVTGWRRKAASRGACVLLGLTAVVAVLLLPNQPTTLGAGLALSWFARTARTP